jgi:hypothetical protein
MWPFRKRERGVSYITAREAIIGLKSMTDALKEKDRPLYDDLCHLGVSEFWLEWKKVHPEDFPLGGASPANASSVARH